jgi:hypothetical protein
MQDKENNNLNVGDIIEYQYQYNDWSKGLLKVNKQCKTLYGIVLEQYTIDGTWYKVKLFNNNNSIENIQIVSRYQDNIEVISKQV